MLSVRVYCTGLLYRHVFVCRCAWHPLYESEVEDRGILGKALIPIFLTLLVLLLVLEVIETSFWKPSLNAGY